MGSVHNPTTTDQWPERLKEWMGAMGWLRSDRVPRFCPAMVPGGEVARMVVAPFFQYTA